ncbi:hypothetical protein SUGI_0000230 [Cryptomeria japonica]|nr:hypothetical protein SUGI_0000230 [Cryptomeria japonica]
MIDTDIMKEIGNIVIKARARVAVSTLTAIAGVKVGTKQRQNQDQSSPPARSPACTSLYQRLKVNLQDLVIQDNHIQFAKYGPNAEVIHKGRLTAEAPSSRRYRSRSPRLSKRRYDDYRYRDNRRRSGNRMKGIMHIWKLAQFVLRRQVVVLTEQYYVLCQKAFCVFGSVTLF